MVYRSHYCITHVTKGRLKWERFCKIKKKYGEERSIWPTAEGTWPSTKNSWPQEKIINHQQEEITHWIFRVELRGCFARKRRSKETKHSPNTYHLALMSSKPKKKDLLSMQSNAINHKQLSYKPIGRKEQPKMWSRREGAEKLGCPGGGLEPRPSGLNLLQFLHCELLNLVFWWSRECCFVKAVITQTHTSHITLY